MLITVSVGRGQANALSQCTDTRQIGSMKLPLCLDDLIEKFKAEGCTY